MELVIVSPVRRLYSAEADEVSFPGTAGRFTVLTGHAPLISSLEEGDIIYTVHGRQTSLRVKRGCVRVLNDSIEACVETDASTSAPDNKEKE